jgi:hypothetical protein
LSIRKWNRNLSPLENMRASFKQSVVKLNIYSTIAWSLLWVLASFLAAIDFEEETVIPFFLVLPLAAFVITTCAVYFLLPSLSFGRSVIDFEADQASSGGWLQWGITILYFAAWLPFVHAGDAGWVAVTDWIATPVAMLAGVQAGVGLLAFSGRSV